VFNENKAIIFLGSDYNDFMDFLIAWKKAPELDAFGTAISEKNRVEILDLILNKDEITIRDIEQELGFTGTNAYYHFMVMLRVNMIKSRSQGRTVMYSINKQYFHAVCEILKRYSESQNMYNK
jgi:DNA-binding transcriptional ArsR family regulator